MGTANNCMVNFPSVAFQTSLVLEAILFGVFGFLYSVFGLYYSLVTPTNPHRPTILGPLIVVCRFFAVFITLNAVIAIGSLVSLNLLGLRLDLNMLLGYGLAATLAFIAIFSLVWSFKYMK